MRLCDQFNHPLYSASAAERQPVRSSCATFLNKVLYTTVRTQMCQPSEALVFKKVKLCAFQSLFSDDILDEFTVALSANTDHLLLVAYLGLLSKMAVLKLAIQPTNSS